EPVPDTAGYQQPIRLRGTGQAVPTGDQRGAAPGQAQRTEHLSGVSDQLRTATKGVAIDRGLDQANRPPGHASDAGLLPELRNLQEDLHPGDSPEGPGIRADHRPAGSRGGGEPSPTANHEPDQFPAKPRTERERSRDQLVQLPGAKTSALPRPRYL